MGPILLSKDASLWSRCTCKSGRHPAALHPPAAASAAKLATRPHTRLLLSFCASPPSRRAPPASTSQLPDLSLSTAGDCPPLPAHPAHCRRQQPVHPATFGFGRASEAHLLRGYLGSRVSLSVFGRWKVVEYRGLRSFLKVLRDTAFSAFCALPLSPPAEHYGVQITDLPTCKW